MSKSSKHDLVNEVVDDSHHGGSSHTSSDPVAADDEEDIARNEAFESSPPSNEETSVNDSPPSHADGGVAIDSGNTPAERLSNRTPRSENAEDLLPGRSGGESIPGPGSSSTRDDNDCEVDDADDEQGPPPLVLERQPSASAPKTTKCAPARTASSASSQDSSTAPPSIRYTSVREIFQSSSFDDRQQNLSSTNTIIPVGQLRKLATAGSLDSSHRGVSWRILLGYLSPDRSQWSTDLEKQRNLYRDLCHQLFANPIDDGTELKQQPRRRLSRSSFPSSSFRGAPNGEDDSSSNVGADDDLTAPAAAARDGKEELGKGSTNRDDPKSRALSAPALPAPSVPQAVRDAWKRSGRDSHVLESVCSGINALRLPESTDAALDAAKEGYSRECEDFVTTAALLDEIRKDVVRTCSDLSFYLDPALGMRRYAVLERILLISATLSNRAVRYVQGMNEIVAILYFVLTSLDEDDEEEEDDGVRENNSETQGDGKMESDVPAGDSETQGDGKMESDVPAGDSSAFSDVARDNEDDADENAGTSCEGGMPDWADHAEPDTYWLFHALLSEMSDVFVPDMDSAETGIQGRIAAMHELLKRHDMETAEHLEEIGIDTGFYAVRWLTTLLSREFRLPDTVRLWDSMFASTHKDNFIRYVCVTMVLIIRDLLLKADFSTCLRMLQSYPPTNMEQLLESSRALWVYESQITVACHRGGISLHQALQTIAPPPGIVFAFGLRNGLLQPRDKDGGAKPTELKVREATQAVASQAQVFFGRARGLYSRSMLEYRKYRSASTASSANSDAKLAKDSGSDLAPVSRSNSHEDLDASAECPLDDPDDSIYMEAILKA